MAKAPAAPRSRQRKRPVEVPGSESAGEAPITTAAVNQTISEANELAKLKEVEADAIQTVEVIAESGVQRYAGNATPEIGSMWAGMVLTESGWMNPAHVDKSEE